MWPQVMAMVGAMLLGFLAGLVTFRRTLRWCPECGETLTCPRCAQGPGGVRSA